jgi:hypothetical protein
MNSLWDIGIFLGLLPKQSPCIMGSLSYMRYAVDGNTICAAYLYFVKFFVNTEPRFEMLTLYKSGSRFVSDSPAGGRYVSRSVCIIWYRYAVCCLPEAVGPNCTEAGHSYRTVAVPSGHAKRRAKGILNPFREGCFILWSNAFEIYICIYECI